MMRAHNIVAALLCSCTMSIAVDAAAQSPAKTVPPTTTPTTLPPINKSAAPKSATKDEPDPWAGRTDLYLPPNLQPTTKVNVGQLSRSTTTNGMLLITVPRHTVASVDVTLVPAKPGSAAPTGGKK